MRSVKHAGGAGDAACRHDCEKGLEIANFHGLSCAPCIVTYSYCIKRILYASDKRQVSLLEPFVENPMSRLVTGHIGSWSVSKTVRAGLRELLKRIAGRGLCVSVFSARVRSLATWWLPRQGRSLSVRTAPSVRSICRDGWHGGRELAHQRLGRDASDRPSAS
ncbi:hypothetical protein D9M70_512210 [compost metagenome]